jgi:hypothetical protein
MLYSPRVPLRLAAIAAWTVTLTIIAAVTTLMGGGISTGTSVIFLAAAVLPPAVFLIVYRGAPPKSVSQVLYDEERAPVRVPGLQRPGQDRS